ncbi:cysteine hydrolase family protein [Lysinibacillus sp. NPDC097214]|uniref:cysteine hydrolase family protein n=1 Tax=Lysinibacillus sp. NPDC097214 TaxID=3390584 RepID=UPI003CFCE4D9
MVNFETFLFFRTYRDKMKRTGSFSKNRADAYSNPSLVTYLKNNEINELIVTGVFIEGCVTATVKGALARNFAVTVERDAVAGATDQSKETALTKLAT